MPKEKTAKPDPSVLNVRFVRPDDSFYRFMDYLPNPDVVLKDAHEAIDIYQSMKTDPRIKSLLKVAKSAVLNYPLILDQQGASDAVYQFVQTQGFGKVKPYQVAKRLQSATVDGFSVAELVWESKEGAWIPVDVVARKATRFAFDSQGRLKLRSQGALVDLSTAQHRYKWLIHRHDKDAENPYGSSVLSAAYWAWKFKKAGAEFWIMATEKFAVPTLMALFESTDSEDKTRERASALASMLMQTQSGSGAALANIKEVKELGAHDRIADFKVLMDWCDTQIAYAIVYQSLSVQEAEHGTRAQASVHADTFQSAVKADCRDLAETLQRLVDWIVELNFGPGEVSPRIKFDLEDQASWDEIIQAVDRQIPVSKSAIYSRYGVPEPENEEDIFLMPQTSPGIGGFGLADDLSDKKKALRARRPLTL